MAVGQSLDISNQRIKALMRLKPSLKDTAAFFECSQDTIQDYIRENFDLTFSEFREQNAVHSRLELQRNAMRMANEGNVPMMIFCLKNLCGWKDKWETTIENLDLNY